MYEKTFKKWILAAMFLALGIVLPFITGLVKELGDSFLWIHIPVLLCGMVCGPVCGLSVGLLLPFMRSMLLAFPLYPRPVWTAMELATYGLVIGILYLKLKNKSMKWHYFCLITAMLAGRVVWGLSKAVLLGFAGESFTFYAFLSGGFLDAIPGILLQLILIPSLMWLFKKVSLEKKGI